MMAASSHFRNTQGTPCLSHFQHQSPPQRSSCVYHKPRMQRQHQRQQYLQREPRQSWWQWLSRSTTGHGALLMSRSWSPSSLLVGSILMVLIVGFLVPVASGTPVIGGGDGELKGLVARTEDGGGGDAPTVMPGLSYTRSRHIKRVGKVVDHKRDDPDELVPVSRQEDLRKRDSSSISSAVNPTTLSVTPSTETSSAATSSTSSRSTATPLSTTFPQPFDTSLAGFVTKTCPVFFQSFLNNATFQDCYPFSLLLKTSYGFFQAMTSDLQTTKILDKACAADVNKCTVYMSALAKSLLDSSNCGTDYSQGVQVATQAYLGLQAYGVEYSASCLRDEDGYCFAADVSDRPGDISLYFLPLNLSLGAKSTPSCTSCTRDMMAIFQTAAAHRSQAISGTYPDAARQINVNCGPDFVNTSLPDALSVAGLPRVAELRAASSLLLLVVGSVMAAVMLL